MKKIFSIILAVMLLLGVTASIYAEATYTGGPDARVKTATVSKSTTAALSTVVTAGNRILGVTYSDSAAGAIAVADYGTASDANVLTYLVVEVYVAAGTSGTIMFPFPRDVVYGVVTKMNTATGTGVIYYQ